ncbi:MAG: DJ-1/PfpI family protein [Firmicutes bacterium]|nr:DJ-1/PfpI family protein [Bacillota bacterium]
MGKTVAFVIAEKDFRDEEYQIPKEIMEKNGHRVITVSTTLNEAVGKLGMKVKPDNLITEINNGAIDGLIFVGGGGSSQYFGDRDAHHLAEKVYDQGKIIGAICIAPVILARAGLLKGKKATVFPDGIKELESNGAIYTGALVEVEGGLITGSGPEAAEAFGNKLASMLA